MTALEYAILLLVFLVCLSIIWNSLRVGITPVPSSQKARELLLEASAQAPPGTILELGSGWGQLALTAAKKYPHRQVVGYEISPIPWLFSLAMKRLRGADNLSLKRQNFLKGELPQAGLVICYLHPGGMQQLAEKLRRERPQIGMLVSNTFALPGHEPEQIFRLADLYRSPIYVYRLDKMAGSEFEK